MQAVGGRIEAAVGDAAERREVRIQLAGCGALVEQAAPGELGEEAGRGRAQRGPPRAPVRIRLASVTTMSTRSSPAPAGTSATH